MAKTKIIAANWKMNKGIEEATVFITKLNKAKIPADKKVIICPPFTALAEVGKTLNKKISLGAQNMHFEEKGAFTGEISALMLKEVGCNHVIIGHSERRHIFGEDNFLINKKLDSAIRHGFTAIFCVGEKAEERKSGKTREVILKQLIEGLTGITEISGIIIAYEPVWAIGTGVNATPEQAEDVHEYIREQIRQKYNAKAASNLMILYGGSVTPDNFDELLKQNNIDGLLVGGASLDFEKFSKMIS